MMHHTWFKGRGGNSSLTFSRRVTILYATLWCGAATGGPYTSDFLKEKGSIRMYGCVRV